MIEIKIKIYPFLSEPCEYVILYLTNLLNKVVNIGIYF